MDRPIHWSGAVKCLTVSSYILILIFSFLSTPVHAAEDEVYLDFSRDDLELLEAAAKNDPEVARLLSDYRDLRIKGDRLQARSTAGIAGEIWVDAFPKPDRYWQRERGEVQFMGGIAETLVAGGVGYWASRDRGMGGILETESRREARAAMQTTNNRLWQLLEERDRLQSAYNAAASRAGEARDYLNNGRQVFSHMMTIQTGKNTSTQVPVYRTEYASAAKQAELKAEELSFRRTMAELQPELDAAKTAAIPAEEQLTRDAKRIVKDIRAGRINNESLRRVYSRYKWRVAGFIAKVAGSAYMAVEGPIRAYNATEGRNSGWAPLISLGAAVKRRIVDTTIGVQLPADVAKDITGGAR